MTVNLCFHGIGHPTREREPGEGGYWISTQLFAAIVDEATQWPHVELSFDDGNKSDIAVALPALVDRGLRAAFFPLAGRLTDPLSLNPTDLRTIRAAGMQLGSHGWSHIPWRHLSGRQARRELVDARAALTEASEGDISTAALPLGRYDRRLLAQLRNLGYRVVYTSDRTHSRPNSWLHARYSVTANDTIDSIRRIALGRPRLSETLNFAKGVVKRLR